MKNLQERKKKMHSEIIAIKIIGRRYENEIVYTERVISIGQIINFTCSLHHFIFKA